MILSTLTLVAFFLFVIVNFLTPKNISTKFLMNASAMSFLILIYWFFLGIPSFIINLNWFSWTLNQFSVSLIIDFPFVIFSAVGLFVTWSIIQFSEYYMSTDPNKGSFINTLTLFLLFMMLLVSSNNLFVLFVGWEGVGIMSFILIGWWFTRSEANSSAIQAIIYNRIGDSGMVVFMAITILELNSWNLNEILLANSTILLNIGILGVILAATGKSAQFSLHPWLPAAMEGPTPVSALLHSSTMVVAGVFLLFRCSPLFSTQSWILSIIAILGALTALFAASAALVQYDMKKIVAYSTTSQLGLMVVAIGINMPELALFHICTHAFFKALLFLCSGSVIHSFNNEQDLRKMSNAASVLPITISSIVIGSLALCGLPFLAGYYSKDLILEAGQLSISNSISVILSMVATLMTAIYSIRMLFFLMIPSTSSNAINPISEEYKNLSEPILRLTLGVFISGWFLTISLMNSEPLVVPFLNKITPILLLIIATTTILLNIEIPQSQLAINFLSSNWFYVNILHNNILLKLINNSIIGVLRSLDQGWTSLIGAIGLSSSTLAIIKNLLSSHNSHVTSYLKIFLITITVIFIYCLL
uniref:NADH-ubiquinone oxidoreductase chain 5 n=1 Tax=Ophiuroglypha kinbergi TaxID=3253740 RepID=A0A7G9M4U2_9ECHI|nr:NADH dehydrogenase subunit 5 [Ophiura kinbergi]QNN00529.1 NADH dehydrogenase subunit 5 [Ophiura kinbergi]